MGLPGRFQAIRQVPGLPGRFWGCWADFGAPRQPHTSLCSWSCPRFFLLSTAAPRPSKTVTTLSTLLPKPHHADKNSGFHRSFQLELEAQLRLQPCLLPTATATPLFNTLHDRIRTRCGSCQAPRNKCEFLPANRTPAHRLPGVQQEAPCLLPSSLLLVLFQKPNSPPGFPAPGAAGAGSAAPGSARCQRPRPCARKNRVSILFPGMAGKVWAQRESCCWFAKNQIKVNSPQICSPPLFFLHFHRSNYNAVEGDLLYIKTQECIYQKGYILV